MLPCERPAGPSPTSASVSCCRSGLPASQSPWRPTECCPCACAARPSGVKQPCRVLVGGVTGNGVWVWAALLKPSGPIVCIPLPGRSSRSLRCCWRWGSARSRSTWAGWCGRCIAAAAGLGAGQVCCARMAASPGWAGKARAGCAGWADRRVVHPRPRGQGPGPVGGWQRSAAAWAAVIAPIPATYALAVVRGMLTGHTP